MTDEVMRRRNRANKNRGRRFDRQIAEIMNWQRVPVSGAMKEFPGDVIDGTLGKSDGVFCVECKSQQYGASGTISVTKKAIAQASQQAMETDRFPVMAFTHQGRQHIYICVPHDPTWVFVFDSLRLPVTINWTTKARGKGNGFAILGRWISQAHREFKRDWLARVDVANSGLYYFMHVDFFKRVVKDNGLDRPSER